MKKLTQIAIIGVLTLVTIFSSSCVSDKKAITEVATDFVNTYQNQEYSRTLDLLSNRLRSDSGDQALINRMQLARLFSGNSRLKSMGEPVINGNTAKVWVDTEGLFGLTNSVQLSLMKENGKWKIDGF